MRKGNASRVKGFFNLSLEEKRDIVRNFSKLTTQDIKNLKRGLPLEVSQRMIENVIGNFELPLGIAVNFKINGRDYLIPYVLEEPSVVAAASKIAKIARETGGFFAKATSSLMVGQIFIEVSRNCSSAKKKILERKKEIIKEIREKNYAHLREYGGGVKDLKVRCLKDKFLRIHLFIDCRDAMGANAVNTILEKSAPIFEKLGKSKAILRIISNLAEKRLATAKVTIRKDLIGGAKVVKRVVAASEIASLDKYRAATHNKGIMNAVSAIVLATGNDFRAVEAGAHSFACRGGKYKPLSFWKEDKNGNLEGKITMPLAVGIIGGATKANPLATLSLKILGVKSAQELAQVIVSAGLAQNLGAILALVTEGIQKGHMKLHARNIVMSIGAKGKEVDLIVKKMIKEKNISIERAKEVFEGLRKRK